MLSNPLRPGMPVDLPTPYRKGAPHYNRPSHEPRTMPLLPSGPTDGTNRKGYCRFSQSYERPEYPQRPMVRPFRAPYSHLLNTTRTLYSTYALRRAPSKRWAATQSPRKPECRNARKSGWGDLWVLGAKALTNRNTKIGGGSRKTISKCVTIKDPHGDGVRAIVKDKTITFLKVKKR
ncbi:hypothetical protein HOY80DRAFT_1023319 [Tuber brumale]|nr:hypothetical protein HOY80DRAFT_1023319 [Tuber brumale]